MKLREIRKEQKMSANQLARQVGVTRQAISRIELGLSKPSIELAKKLGRVLYCDWTVFFED